MPPRRSNKVNELFAVQCAQSKWLDLQLGSSQARKLETRVRVAAAPLLRVTPWPRDNVRMETRADQWPVATRLKAQIKIADTDAEPKSGCFPSNIWCVNAMSELVWARAGDGRRWDDPISAGAVAGAGWCWLGCAATNYRLEVWSWSWRCCTAAWRREFETKVIRMFPKISQSQSQSTRAFSVITNLWMELFQALVSMLAEPGGRPSGQIVRRQIL